MDMKSQLEWEQEMVTRGSNRYNFNQKRLKDKGQGDQSDICSYLVRDRLLEVGKLIEAKANQSVGKGAKYNKVLRMSVINEDYTRLAYIGLQTLLQKLMLKDKVNITAIVQSIGTKIETDIKCYKFESEYPAYYNVVLKSLEEQNVGSYDWKHRTMMKKFGDFNIAWNDWSVTVKVQIGTKILDCILEVFSDILEMRLEKKGLKTVRKLYMTEEFGEWQYEFEKERGLLFPMYLPLKVEPRDWEHLRAGGYYSPQMVNNLEFVKVRGIKHREWVELNNPEEHIKAVNKLQKTEWKVNNFVLDVQNEVYKKSLGIGMPSNMIITPPAFPEHLKKPRELFNESEKEQLGDWKELAKRAHGREQQRKGKVLAMMQGHRLAQELRDWEKFYFAYNCDFRGRIYCMTNGLSPQGADTSKGLLMFANGVELGRDGVKWLAIHGANTYGIDKVSFDERVKWIQDNQDNIAATYADPIANREFWGNADKPYQFLAFCEEWVKCRFGHDETFVSHLPVGLDGSCNGLQHYSALLKDKVGAASTNLMNSELPADIYGDVEKVCKEALKELDHPLAKKWLEVNFDRKLPKRPVMTLPYGSTQQSCRQYVYEWVIEHWDRFDRDEKYQWEYVRFLTPILWASIGHVVIAAREGMKWLRANISKEYTKWVTPIGFPVYQAYKKSKFIQVKTQLCGDTKLYISDHDAKGEPAMVQQRNGIAPNFIHSVDSTHMVLYINATECKSLAMVHDDFGTHAGNTQYAYKLIRDSFLELYSGECLLEHWGKQVGANIDTIPEKGDYDINEITEAEFFFS